jgi:hypothetical protein
VGVPGVPEGMVHAASRVVQDHAHEEGFLLALLDFKTAFNPVSKVWLFELVRAICHLSCSILMYVMVDVPTCLWGHRWWGHPWGHQRDPRGPLVFAL